MSTRRIKDMAARRQRQKITGHLSNRKRQAWGDQGRQVSKSGRPVFRMGQHAGSHRRTT